MFDLHLTVLRYTRGFQCEDSPLPLFIPLSAIPTQVTMVTGTMCQCFIYMYITISKNMQPLLIYAVFKFVLIGNYKHRIEKKLHLCFLLIFNIDNTH